MKQRQYKAPIVHIVEIKAGRLLGSESMTLDSTNKVTNDNSVFSRSNHSEWDDDEE